MNLSLLLLLTAISASAAPIVSREWAEQTLMRGENRMPTGLDLLKDPWLFDEDDWMIVLYETSEHGLGVGFDITSTLGR